MALLYTEPRRAGEFLISEAPGSRSRDELTVAYAVSAGQVLGAATKPVKGVAVYADPANVGDGTVAATPDPAAAPGDYVFTFSDATTVAGVDPDGRELAPIGDGGTVAGLTLSISAGGTPFEAGDKVTITVSSNPGPGEIDAWDPTASDGRETPIGIAFADAAAGSNVAVIARDAEVVGSLLGVPAGAGNLETAAAGLASLGIITR